MRMRADPPFSLLSLYIPVHALSVACLLVTWYCTLLNNSRHSSSLSSSGVSRDLLRSCSLHELPGGGSLWLCRLRKLPPITVGTAGGRINLSWPTCLTSLEDARQAARILFI